jgi:hypothetical protein
VGEIDAPELSAALPFFQGNGAKDVRSSARAKQLVVRTSVRIGKTP